MAGKFTSFLGETTDRNEVFRQWKSFEVVVRQDQFGLYRSREHMRESRFNKTNVISQVRCLNPRCQQGGLSLQFIIDHAENGVPKVYYCAGHEGSPKGRVKGAPCTNSFEVTVTKVPA